MRRERLALAVPDPLTVGCLGDLMPVGRFRPAGQEDLAPAGDRAKAAANLAALRRLRDLAASGREPTVGDQVVLARWAGWGAVPHFFDPDDAGWAAERAELQGLVSETEWAAAARRTTLNAHYTDATVVDVVWAAVERLGFSGGAVLEPGCGVFRKVSMSQRGELSQGVVVTSCWAAQRAVPQPG